MVDSKPHQWKFLAIGDDGTPRVAVVCTVCGAARSSLVPTVANMERHIALGGTCPGEPQPQDVGPVASS
jgi:hypothetical protein